MLNRGFASLDVSLRRTLALRFEHTAVMALSLAASVLAGCNSNPSTDDGGLDVTSEAVDLCNSPFNGVGTPCPRVSATVCFPECTNGGCKCVASASGPVWACTTDLSCLPCAGPLDDGSADCGADGAAPEAGDDGAADAGADAGDDGSTDGAQE